MALRFRVNSRDGRTDGRTLCNALCGLLGRLQYTVIVRRKVCLCFHQRNPVMLNDLIYSLDLGYNNLYIQGNANTNDIKISQSQSVIQLYPLWTIFCKSQCLVMYYRNHKSDVTIGWQCSDVTKLGHLFVVMATCQLQQSTDVTSSQTRDKLCISTCNVIIIRAVPDLFFPIRPEPDFQIDSNFTNLMCKTLRTYEWFEFWLLFLLFNLW